MQTLRQRYEEKGAIAENERITKVIEGKLNDLKWAFGRYDAGTPQKIIFHAKIEDIEKLLKDIRRPQ